MAVIKMEIYNIIIVQKILRLTKTKITVKF